MRIVLLPSADGSAIAWEEQFGRREGAFFLAAHGRVL